MDVNISAATLQVSLSLPGMNMTQVLISDSIPRNLFTNYLSRSIRSVVAAFGPWSAGYGLPPISAQYLAPPVWFDVQLGTSAVSVQLSTTIHVHPPANSSVIIAPLDDDSPEEGAIFSETVTDGLVDEGGLSHEVPLDLIDDAGTLPITSEAIAEPVQNLTALNPVAPMENSNDVLQSSLGLMAPAPSMGLSQALSDALGQMITRGRRSKAQTPVISTEVRRSTRSTRYDGFRVPQVTDAHATISKVKPRSIPSAAAGSSSSMSEVPGNSAPPPTPIQTMQAIGINRCAIPPAELTEDALLGSRSEDDQVSDVGTGADGSAPPA